MSPKYINDTSESESEVVCDEETWLDLNDEPLR